MVIKKNSRSVFEKKSLVFFNYLETIGPSKVGGLDTMARAFGDMARDNGHDVLYLSYGWSASDQCTIGHDIRVGDFGEALDVLDQHDGLVVSFYIERRNRLPFLVYRWRNRSFKRFLFYISVWNPNRLKRFLGFFELFYSFNAGTFGASERLVKLGRKFDREVKLMCPPTRSTVENHFRSSEVDTQIFLSFAGRFDKRKGLIEAIEIMKETNSLIECKCLVSGYFWPNDSDEIEIRELLSKHAFIEVRETNVNNWNETAEQRLEEQLVASDVVLLPYKKLSSTVDTPLLVLEAMAKKCVVYMPKRPRELLDFLSVNPRCLAPENDTAAAVARWIVILAKDREKLHVIQDENAESFARHQLDTRDMFHKILADY